MPNLSACDVPGLVLHLAPGTTVDGLAAGVATARLDGRTIGRLMWLTVPVGLQRPGCIELVEVAEQWRRRGIATALWQAAAEADPRLHHASARSRDGELWARAVGGPGSETAAELVEVIVPPAFT
jgi:GNAT superfamily N-acetyltransferase